MFGRVVRFARPDAHDVLEVHHEDLPVADPAGVRGRGDRLDHLVAEFVGNGDLELDLREKVNDVFGAAIELRMSLLAPEALDFRGGEAADAAVRERFAHVVELERLDDRNDVLHGFSSVSEMLCADGGESRVLDPFLSKRRAKGPYSSMGDEIRQMEPQRGLKREEIRLKTAAEAF